MPLTDAAVRNAKAGPKPLKLANTRALREYSPQNRLSSAAIRYNGRSSELRDDEPRERRFS
jgi:hypothetical protein